MLLSSISAERQTALPCQSPPVRQHGALSTVHDGFLSSLKIQWQPYLSKYCPYAPNSKSWRSWDRSSRCPSLSLRVGRRMRSSPRSRQRWQRRWVTVRRLHRQQFPLPLLGADGHGSCEWSAARAVAAVPVAVVVAAPVVVVAAMAPFMPKLVDVDGRDDEPGERDADRDGEGEPACAVAISFCGYPACFKAQRVVAVPRASRAVSSPCSRRQRSTTLALHTKVTSMFLRRTLRETSEAWVILKYAILLTQAYVVVYFFSQQRHASLLPPDP